MFQILYLCKSFCVYMILLIKIYITQKERKEKHWKQCTKMKYKMNNFKYINTLERKRIDKFSNNKINIKSKADEEIRSQDSWVIGKYALHCDTVLVWSAVLIAL